MLPRLPVGERFRDRLRRRGCTQAVLAGLCGITTDYLSQIERGLKTLRGCPGLVSPSGTPPARGVSNERLCLTFGGDSVW
ncbi:helix-turn-helix transcriptional regulator [Streptomyces sp. PvR018]|uniref:helix-turn-helix transcriptional regulator n=1 Tax=Streptomyces sp. PvR018 TaxID=3156442 RepID=UPI001A27ACE1|nr:helix-turn-helix transcriptional regulator [Streptomyces sp. MBT57]WTF67211.1 helix-turn-helix domain-containing protein [Streptomyces microflavus]